MNLVDRLKIYMEHTGLPISQFADVAFIPRPTLSQILSGRNKKISNEILEKLHSAFPSLNIAWLLFGDGNMLRDNSAPAPTPKPQIADIHNQSTASVPSPQPTQVDEATTEQPKDVPYEKSPDPVISLAPDNNKKIQTIMVFYTDNSFEIFTPAPR